MVFQSYALYPHLSVFENIAFPLRVAKMPEAELKERVARAANILQLNDKLKLKPAQLSGWPAAASGHRTIHRSRA